MVSTWPHLTDTSEREKLKTEGRTNVLENRIKGIQLSISLKNSTVSYVLLQLGSGKFCCGFHQSDPGEHSLAFRSLSSWETQLSLALALCLYSTVGSSTGSGPTETQLTRMIRGEDSANALGIESAFGGLI